MHGCHRVLAFVQKDDVIGILSTKSIVEISDTLLTLASTEVPGIVMKKHHLREACIPANKRQRANAASKKIERQQYTGTSNQRQVESSTVCCWMDYESIESIHSLSLKKINYSKESMPLVINTKVASSTMTEIFLSRLHKEIILPFRFTLSSQLQLLDSDQNVYDATKRRNMIQRRIYFGYNSVSKLLFDANSNKATKPSLIVVVNPDNNYQNNSHMQQPFTSSICAPMLQHIPVLAYEMKIPLFILPSSYCIENLPHGKVENFTITSLATVFGWNRNHTKMTQFSCFAFTHQPQCHPYPQELRLLHHTIDDRTPTLKTTDDNSMTEDSNEEKQIHISIDSFVNYFIGKIEI